PANRSARPARVSRRKTNGTFGRSSATSSPSANLQSRLANRLRQRLGAYGSLEYALTWKDWDMLSGPRICALRASARRTSGKDSTERPTRQARDGISGEQATRCDGERRNLNDFALLAGWPTATVNDSRGGRNMTSGRSNPNSQHHDGMTLCDAATLAGWPTPMAGTPAQNGNNAAGNND